MPDTPDAIRAAVEQRFAQAARSPGPEKLLGFYSQVIFPRLCDLLLNRPFVAKHRKQLLSTACGDVLEIGFGTGLNLPHYPAQVKRITTVDPNTGMHRLAQRRIRQSKIEVDHRVLSGERLPFEGGTFDCAISTFTLCSIGDVSQALAEVYRVLKPGGQFVPRTRPQPGAKGAEVAAPLNWLEMRLAHGCRLDRHIKELIAAQTFSSVEVEESYLEKTPKTHGYLYRGVARK